MTAIRAQRLCPDAVFLPPDLPRLGAAKSSNVPPIWSSRYLLTKLISTLRRTRLACQPLHELRAQLANKSAKNRFDRARSPHRASDRSTKTMSIVSSNPPDSQSMCASTARPRIAARQLLPAAAKFSRAACLGRVPLDHVRCLPPKPQCAAAAAGLA